MAIEAVDNLVLRQGMQFNTVQDDILYYVLSSSALADELTGIIRKTSKPVRTSPPRVEDCTISSLSIESGTVQLGTSNVNIYVPDITECVTQADADNQDADKGRIKQLAGLAYSILERYYSDSWGGYECVAQDVIPEPTLHCHRIWLKIRFTFHNL